MPESPCHRGRLQCIGTGLMLHLVRQLAGSASVKISHLKNHACTPHRADPRHAACRRSHRQRLQRLWPERASPTCSRTRLRLIWRDAAHRQDDRTLRAARELRARLRRGRDSFYLLAFGRNRSRARRAGHPGTETNEAMLGRRWRGNAHRPHRNLRAQHPPLKAELETQRERKNYKLSISYRAVRRRSRRCMRARPMNTTA